MSQEAISHELYSDQQHELNKYSFLLNESVYWLTHKYLLASLHLKQYNQQKMVNENTARPIRFNNCN